MDDRRLIAKLHEVDPEFGPFMEALGYVSKSGGAAAPTGDPAKDKKVAQGALVGTGVATAGGLHALAGTKAEHKVRASEMASGAKQTPKVLRRLGPKKAGAAITGGWLALHGVELAADAANAHTQTKQIRAANEKIQKGLPGHFQPIGLVRANARANQMGQRLRGATYRRPRGAVTPVQKGMFTPVEKGLKNVADAAGLLNHLGSPAHAEQLGNWGRKAAQGEHDAKMARFDMRRPQPGPTSGGKHRPTPAGGSVRPVAAGPKHAAAGGGRISRKQAGAAAGGLTLLAGGAGGGVAAERKRVPQSAPGERVAKSADCEWVGEISKVDTEKRQVFGWASLSMVDGEPVLDRQGDYIAIEDSEDAAYRYMLSSRKGGDMHSRISKLDGGPKHTADVIESIVFTPEKIEALGLEPDALPLGWWIGMKVHDDQQWDDIKSGRRTGFSVHGTGVRKDMVMA